MSRKIAAPLPTRPFTIREKELIGLYALGHTSMEIALKLNLSLHTVNNHRRNIIEKAGVRTMRQLLMKHLAAVLTTAGA